MSGTCSWCGRDKARCTKNPHGPIAQTDGGEVQDGDE